MRDTERYSNRMRREELAARYSARFETGPRKRIDQREQRAVRRIFSNLPDCRNILDVPSGAGRFAAALSTKGRHLTEMDVAGEILQFARERTSAQSVAADFAQGDASRLPIGDGAVDCVFCNRLLHHILTVPERAVFLRELHRVTRRWAVVSFFDYQSFKGIRLFFKRLKGRKTTYAGQPTLEEFRREVTDCGFQIQEIVPTGAFWVAQKYFVLRK